MILLYCVVDDAKLMSESAIAACDYVDDYKSTVHNTSGENTIVNNSECCSY